MFQKQRCAFVNSIKRFKRSKFRLPPPARNYYFLCVSVFHRDDYVVLYVCKRVVVKREDERDVVMCYWEWVKVWGAKE